MKLLTVKDENARRFYEDEALRGGWSVRQHDRQIGSIFYERTLLSKDKAAKLRKGAKPQPGDALSADEALRDPLVLEFLNLRDEYSETDLEDALVRHLETFLLELGGDFTFVGRQRRLRAEISVNYPFQPGDTVRYAWRFMVPKGSQTDAPKNRWWLIGQWHDQPNKDRGETWSGFPSRSPPVLLGFGGLENQLATGVAYGLDQSQKGAPVFIEPGKWHRVAFESRWSQHADGRATFYFDDLTMPAAVFEGPNLHNDYQHYLKLGMYRHPDIKTDNWIYLDDLAITKLAVR